MAGGLQCATVAEVPPPLTVYFGVEACDVFGRCAATCEQAVVLDTVAPRITQAQVCTHVV